MPSLLSFAGSQWHSCAQGKCRNAKQLIRRASSYVLHYGFAWYWAVSVLKVSQIPRRQAEVFAVDLCGRREPQAGIAPSILSGRVGPSTVNTTLRVTSRMVRSPATARSPLAVRVMPVDSKHSRTLLAFSAEQEDTTVDDSGPDLGGDQSPPNRI